MKKLYYILSLILFLPVITFSQSWVEQTQPATGIALNSVSAYDDNNVWVCGNSGTVLRTTNGGTNWLSVGSAPIASTTNLTNIFGIDANTALVTGSTATATFVYRTSNGGTNWVQVFTQTGGFIDAILMGNSVAGFMVGDPVGGRWSLWGTVTGGLTWDSTQFYLPQNGSEAGWNNSFFFDNVSQAVWFGTNNTRIYKSTNLIIWGTQPTTTQLNSYALWFNSSTNGMTGGTAMLLTTNAGANWNATGASMPGTANVSGITGFGTYWWVTRQASVVYFTNNDGGAWASQYTAPAGNYFAIGKSRNGAGTIYAVRSNGGISKATNITAISPVSNQIPVKFSLKQNYPNPFNPSTVIKFDIPGTNSSNVKLIIYDQLGRKVTELVNQQLNPGSYEVKFDASNIASGIYYYKIYAGDFTSAKKMTLIK